MNIRTGLKIVAGFAAAGFFMAWLLLAFCAWARELGWHLSTTPLLYLCPSSIMSLGLDNASLLVGLLGWVLIAFSNAVLYAAVGIPFGIVIGARRSRMARRLQGR